MIEANQEEQIVTDESVFAPLYLPLLLKGPSDATGTAQNEALSTQTVDEAVDIERKKVQLMLSSASARYQSERQQAETELELSRLRATQTIQALGEPLPVETVVAQLLMVEQEHMQSCLFPTPDPVQSMILQKEIDLAQIDGLARIGLSGHDSRVTRARYGLAGAN